MGWENEGGKHEEVDADVVADVLKGDGENEGIDWDCVVFPDVPEIPFVEGSVVRFEYL